MNPRKIAWDDVQLNVTPWQRAQGGSRVHASLRGCSFINVLMWFDAWREDPAQRAAVMLALMRKAKRIMDHLKPYVA